MIGFLSKAINVIILNIIIMNKWIAHWQQIKLGFEEGLTMEQAKLYADPKFDDEQMAHIQIDLKKGLSIDEVKEKYNLASRRNNLNRVVRRKE